MNSRPKLEEVKSLVDRLPIPERVALLEDLTEKLQALGWIKLAETGFSEWNDPEEDIYDVHSF
ncbi:hypothetical protein V0288_05400 [Pannus brasiliensis CCIBt3594]|uniref:Uncharacterized protein n=1 Tax=Pannus brasiliensis CCIBt3594 TaxID=1427578 RepID=A0AAW9QST4_9CHRO